MRPAVHGALVADIGGTNARLALAVEGRRELSAVRHLRCADFPDLVSLLEHYLQDATSDTRIHPGDAWLALAGPVDSDPVQLTNRPWRFSREQLLRQLQLTRLELVNDFAAQARGVLELDAARLTRVLGGTPRIHGPRLVIGPGTGLGMALLVPTGNTWLTLPSEGGHVHFAPTNADEDRLLAWFRQRHQRVSVERLLSGDGLLGLYQAHAEQANQRLECTTPAQVSAAGARGNSLAVRSIRVFLKVLGDVAGDAALTAGARGGVYLCGGILPRLQIQLGDSGFAHAFRDKGRLGQYISDIPVWLAADDTLGLRGVAALWRQSRGRSGKLANPASFGEA